MNLFDVVAVEIEGSRKVRVLAEGRTEKNAEALVKMSVLRRGVDEEFFAAVPQGKYKDGDVWRGQ